MKLQHTRARDSTYTHVSMENDDNDDIFPLKPYCIIIYYSFDSLNDIDDDDENEEGNKYIDSLRLRSYGWSMWRDILISACDSAATMR